MCSSRKSNDLINKVHERSLNSSFEDLLRKCQEKTIHQRDLRVLMAETYKIVNSIFPTIMENIFILRENTDNLRNFQEISNEGRKTLRYGLERIFPFL